VRNAIAVALTMCVLAGCSTLRNIAPDFSTLPESSMKQVAMEIESAIQRGDRQPQIADRDGIVVNTEDIMQAIRTRAARAEIVNAFRDSGFGRERRNGLIDVGTGSEYQKATTFRKRDTNALLVDGENTNRWTIYEGILKASNFSRKALPAIQRIFHEARVQVMREGQLYENEAGDFVRKGTVAP